MTKCLSRWHPCFPPHRLQAATNCADLCLLYLFQKQTLGLLPAWSVAVQPQVCWHRVGAQWGPGQGQIALSPSGTPQRPRGATQQLHKKPSLCTAELQSLPNKAEGLHAVHPAYNHTMCIRNQPDSSSAFSPEAKVKNSITISSGWQTCP